VPELEAIIGLEVHAQMNTKSKMFCGCDNDAFGKEANTTVCPICMGHPGTLPVPNEESVKKAMIASLAIGCTINPASHFDRKHYFYPDLPAGFQISQYDFPLASKGAVTYAHQGKDIVCGITRLHMENDAGKLMHHGSLTLCDYNRAGTPLMEIVTEPDLRSATEAVSFAEELRRILIAVNASDADMFKGMMRFDASISLREKGTEKLNPRSEPDIPPLSFTTEEIEQVRAALPPLPRQLKERYLALKLTEAEVAMLVDQPLLRAHFDAVFDRVKDGKRASSIVLTQLMGFLKEQGKDVSEGPTTASLAELADAVASGAISGNAAKDVIEKMVTTGKSAKEIIAAEGMQKISDTGAIETLVEKAIAANPKAIESFKQGKTAALGAVVGWVMKESKGQANPKMVNDILMKKL
jgi:aspartyl-tRNA(Asn)/glutamyl-tRNA(Gln) amidotransferase subunit B